ncbi:Nucleoside-triphosphatase THEP1 [Gossypium australe]|uniref:Nucleoside-triphosphatase THEP1 n=1 Tax=Gossypium australe TaxID=47621 RepID=A0A5B6WQZ4_9ROSI|nr:Nucleoside-triphosphatase THEP1 [Gossypium australe]
MENEFLDKVEDNAIAHSYGDLPYLLDIKVGEHLFRAISQYWNSVYSCFTFGRVDLVPTVEEYIVLLRCPKIQVDKAYSRAPNVPTFDLILEHPDMKKKVDVFTLSIYGLVIFPRALGYVDKVVLDLFNRLNKQVTPVPAILAETFRSLSACRRAREGRFIG